MRHFYKKDGRIYEFLADQLDHVTDEFTAMTIAEIDRHLFPEKYMTEQEKLELKRSQYPKLTRYQFMRGLLEMGFKSSDVEAQIMLIEDEYTRELTMLGFKEATNFERTDESILAIQSVLGLTDAKVDMMWYYALNL